jgi:hypothetical protein
MKYIMLILALPTFLFGKAQTNVYKYKAFQTATIDNTKNSIYTADVEWKKVDILVVLNVEKKKLKIYSEAEQDIDLIREMEENTHGTNNKWIREVGIDENGLKCNIEMEIFTDQSGIHVATLFVEYSDLAFVYRLQND